MHVSNVPSTTLLQKAVGRDLSRRAGIDASVEHLANSHRHDAGTLLINQKQLEAAVLKLNETIGPSRLEDCGWDEESIVTLLLEAVFSPLEVRIVSEEF